MSILSFSFVVFVLVAMLIYYVTPGKYQWISLLVISYCFYLFAGVRAVIFILITTTSTFFSGLWIGKINDEFDVAVNNYSGPNLKMTRAEKNRIKEDEDRRKRRIMVFTLILNFGILIALKYINPLVDLLKWVCSLMHLKYETHHFSMIVPLGISYYTFQASGYIIDLYRRKFKHEKHFGHFLLYISFFPQLVQGPISRYNELAPQLMTPHVFNYTIIKHGIELVFWGLFKKLVISDRLAIITSTIFNNPEVYDGFYLFVATVLSMLQLYTDFSGGIDMMRGVAECFGIIMPENFTRPFFATNLSEYWRRWHITLNNWWRDYIFYPMSLSRPFQKLGKAVKKVAGENFGKKFPVLLSVIIIRVINSIWHGATGSSILGGIYYGLLLALSFYFEPQIVRLTKALKINTKCETWKVFQCVRTFILIAAPRLVCNAKNLADGRNYFRCLFKSYNPWILFDGSLFQLGVSQPQMIVVHAGLLLLFVVSFLQERGHVIRDDLDRQNVVFRGIIYLLFLFSIILYGVYGPGYDSSAFIYQQI